MQIDRLWLAAKTMGTERPLGLVIRHAERERLDRVDPSSTATLTDKGREDAARFAHRLRGYAPLAIHHSPVLRCRLTALIIAEGARALGAAVNYAGPLPTLGNSYFRDIPAVAALMDERGTGFVRAWFGGAGAGALQPMEEAAQEQLEAIVCKMEAQPRLTHLFITHDFNLMLVMEHFLGVRHEEHGWPLFLDGVAVGLRSGGVALTCGRDMVHVAPPCARGPD